MSRIIDPLSSRSGVISREQGLIEAFPGQAALLSGAGAMSATNSAWKRFAVEAGDTHPEFATDINFNCLAALIESSGVAIATEVKSAVQNVAAGERLEFEIEYPLQIFGKTRWFRLRVNALAPARQGDAGGAIATHADITEHVLTDEARAGRDASYHIPAEAVLDFVCTIDEGVITFVNAAGVRTLARYRYRVLKTAQWPIQAGRP